MTSNDSRSSRSARNLPLSTCAGRFSLVAATMRTSTLDRLGCADAGDLAIFDARSSRSCAGIDERAELVEEQGAAVGFLEPAVTRLGSAGEAARLMAEQLGLDQILG